MTQTFSRRDFITTTAAMTLPVTPSAVSTDNPPRLSSTGPRSRGKHSVFIGVLPPGFEPADPTVIPERLLLVYRAGGRHTLTSAARVAHAFNRQQLADGLPGRWWAVVVFRSKDQKPHVLDLPQEPQDGPQGDVLDLDDDPNAKPPVEFLEL